MDESLDPSAPTQEAIFKAVDERFDALKRWTVPIPMTDELLKRAAHRVLNKIPPSHDDDAFKDSLLWENVLTLPEGCNVYFCSDDARAFFTPPKNEKFLESLYEEAQARRMTFKAYRDPARLVAALQGDGPALDHRANSMIRAAMMGTFITAMNRFGIEALEDGNLVLNALLTEIPTVLYIQFTFTCPVTSSAKVEDTEYGNTILKFEGDCLYDPHGTVDKLRVGKEVLLGSDGRELWKAGHAFAEGNISLGTPRRRFSYRKPLEE
jgi:hypothetical protein